jgi:cytochrome c oxidase subunit 7
MDEVDVASEQQGRLIDDFAYIGLGISFGYLFWYVSTPKALVVIESSRINKRCRYGYHVPAVRRRDAFYTKLEDKRAADAAALQQA